MDDVKPFEIHSFEEEALLRMAEARTRAREIIQSAGNEKAGVLEEARREGFEKGLAAGRAEAAKEEQSRLAERSAALTSVLEGVIKVVEEQRGALIAAAERDLVKLAVAMAGKIVRAELASSRRISVASARRAIELAASRQRLCLMLHPGDLAQVEAVLPDLKRSFPDLAHVDLKGNESISPGGCVAVAETGAVDAQIETQLAQIERGLLG